MLALHNATNTWFRARKQRAGRRQTTGFRQMRERATDYKVGERKDCVGEGV